jgi:hypothetical protein
MILLFAIASVFIAAWLLSKLLVWAFKDKQRKIVGSAIVIFIGLTLLSFGIIKITSDSVQLAWDLGDFEAARPYALAAFIGLIFSIGGGVAFLTRGSIEKSNSTLKKCSFCAELIQPEAKLCRFCNKVIE